MVTWLADWRRFLEKKLWIVTDGAYAQRPLLQRALAAGAVVVSRPRKDAALRGVPEPPRPGQPKKRGPTPRYGKQAISPAQRAGHRPGWQTADFVL